VPVSAESVMAFSGKPLARVPPVARFQKSLNDSYQIGRPLNLGATEMTDDECNSSWYEAELARREQDNRFYKTLIFAVIGLIFTCTGGPGGWPVGVILLYCAWAIWNRKN
jgi:hypothetical protein